MKQILYLLCLLSLAIFAMDKPLTRKQIEEAYVTHTLKIDREDPQGKEDYDYFLLWKDNAPDYVKLAVFKEKLIQMAQDNNFEGIQATLDLAKEWQLLETPEEVKQLKLYAALFHAVNSGHYEATKCLLQTWMINLASNPNNLLHIVCFGIWHEKEENTRDVITRMLAFGANINKENKQHQKPLDIACGSLDPYTLTDGYAAPKSIQAFLIQNGAKKTQPVTPSLVKASPPAHPNSDWGHPLHDPIRGDFFQDQSAPY